MLVWIRIYPVVVTEDAAEGSSLEMTISSRLHVVVYPSAEAAHSAAVEFGGIVLNVEAGSLKGISEFKEVGLSDIDTAMPGKSADRAYVMVSFGSLPHKMLPAAPAGEPYQGDYADFDDFPESVAWLTELEKALGTRLHQ